MSNKRLEIRNYALFKAYPNQKKYKVLLDDAGVERGIEINGVLTTYDVKNENGTIFKKNSYDKGLSKYFIENNLNVPVTILHQDYNFTHLCGTVSKMESTDTGVIITVSIPKEAYYYKAIKGYIDSGILQGFSNYGWASDGNYDDERKAFVIKDFDLVSVALVAEPADTGARFDVANTRFVGFDNKRDNKQSNNKLQDDFLDLI